MTVQRWVVNGRVREVEVRPGQTLLEVLRDGLGIFDVKEGCGEGVCGACTALLDGRPVSTCLVLAPSVRGRAIRTVRGLGRDGDLHPLQEAFVRSGAVQCGFCTPGMLLTTLAFLERHPRPSREAMRAALQGNLCRCTGYAKILDGIEAYVQGAPGRG
jgi:carbon-monoxide dehydrogenase small subunit